LSPANRWPPATWALLAAPLLVLAALTWFDHPSQDDFWYAVTARQTGFWEIQATWYRQWLGRYTATAIQTGFPLACDMIECYPLVPLSALSAFGLGIAALLAAVNRSLGGPVSRRGVLGATVVFCSVYAVQMPSPCEGFYWLAGTATYWLPTMCGLLMLACPLAIRRDSRPTATALAAVAAGALALVTAGGNETLLPPLGTTLLVGTAWAIRRRHRSGWVWATALACFTLGAAILVLAPGNAVRAAHFHKSPLRAFGASLLHVLTWFPLGPMGIGVMILGIPAAMAVLERLGWSRRIAGRHVVLTGAAAGTLVLLSLLPAASVGSVPPVRALNVTYLIFLGGWFLTAFLFVDWFRNTRRPDAFASPKWRKAAWTLLAAGMLLVGNFPRAVYDLTCLAVPYDRELRARYAAISQQAASNEAEIVIDGLTAIPKTIRPGNLKDDRSPYPHLARYFGAGDATIKVR
jgi:hypothetical protein